MRVSVSVLVQVVAIRGYQPAVPGQEAASTGDKDKEKTEGKEKAEGKEKTGDATDSGPGVRDGEAEAEDEGKEEEGEKKDASRKTEEACLEGLSDEIQDMLVVCAESGMLYQAVQGTQASTAHRTDHAGGVPVPTAHPESSL